MGKTAGRRLKVFQAHLGFYETVVAAPSRAAALRAWGTHQNLFAGGQAAIADDPQAIAAALAHPDVPLMRAVGSREPFALESKSLPTVPEAPKAPRSKPNAKTKPVASRKAPANRVKFDAAEAAARSLDDARKKEEATFRRRQDDLDAERAAAQAAYVEAHEAAVAAVAKARAAYRAAGGEG